MHLQLLTRTKRKYLCVTEEFWLGLAKIYSIAQQGQYILHIELEDWKEEKRFIEYTFTMEGPASDYALHVAHLSGDLPDAMSNHTGMKFSTKDRDNDNHDESNCARNYTGITRSKLIFNIPQYTTAHIPWKLTACCFRRLVVWRMWGHQLKRQIRLDEVEDSAPA